MQTPPLATQGCALEPSGSAGSEEMWLALVEHDGKRRQSFLKEDCRSKTCPWAVGRVPNQNQKLYWQSLRMPNKEFDSAFSLSYCLG